MFVYIHNKEIERQLREFNAITLMCVMCRGKYEDK